VGWGKGDFAPDGKCGDGSVLWGTVVRGSWTWSRKAVELRLVLVLELELDGSWDGD